MAQRTFTLQEAQVLLPVLKSLMKQAIDGKKLIETIDAEFQALAQRIFLSGGLLVEIGKAATRRAERDKTVQRIKDVVAEIDARAADEQLTSHRWTLLARRCAGQHGVTI